MPDGDLADPLAVGELMDPLPYGDFVDLLVDGDLVLPKLGDLVLPF